MSGATRTRIGWPSTSTSPTWPPVVSSSASDRAAVGSTRKWRSAAGSVLKSIQVSPPSDSRTALRVPGIRSASARSAVPRASSRCGSGATIRMPTGVRTLVAIMSMRARAGVVQAAVHPGSRTALSSSSTSSAVVRGVRSGHTWRKIRRSGSGAQRLYQRTRPTLGHSERGRSRIVVSAIE